jgi:hypothetical protein
MSYFIARTALFLEETVKGQSSMGHIKELTLFHFHSNIIMHVAKSKDVVFFQSPEYELLYTYLQCV